MPINHILRTQVCPRINTCQKGKINNHKKNDVDYLQVPTIAVLGSGGGFRAMVSLSGVFCALKDMGILDCVTYVSGLSGSAW